MKLITAFVLLTIYLSITDYHPIDEFGSLKSADFTVRSPLKDYYWYQRKEKNNIRNQSLKLNTEKQI